jgi:hypothetical protein
MNLLIPLLAVSALLFACVDQVDQVTPNRRDHLRKSRVVGSPRGDDDASPQRRTPCPEGIEGRGLRMVESYPPKPDFESFNLWRTKTGTGRSGCLSIVAGQQQSHAADGVDDPATYYPNGWLFIFGDYLHNKDGIGKREVPLPRPVRIVDVKGSGYGARVALQSLANCSEATYDVKTRRTNVRRRSGAYKCPTESH